METKIVVTNRQARMLAVHWNKSPAGAAGVLRLAPGKNLVEESKLKRASENEQFKAWKRIGWVQVGKAVKAAEEAKPAPVGDISKMSAKQAIAHVSEVEDTALLEQWLGTEERASVVKAITERLQAITGVNDDGEPVSDDSESGDSDQG